MDGVLFIYLQQEVKIYEKPLLICLIRKMKKSFHEKPSEGRQFVMEGMLFYLFIFRFSIAAHFRKGYTNCLLLHLHPKHPPLVCYVIKFTSFLSNLLPLSRRTNGLTCS